MSVLAQARAGVLSDREAIYIAACASPPSPMRNTILALCVDAEIDRQRREAVHGRERFETPIDLDEMP